MSEPPSSEQHLRDDNLRTAFASLGPTALPREDCPTPEQLWEGVHGEPEADDIRALISHIAECSSCAEDWRMARALHAEAAAPENSAKPRQLPRRVRSNGPWGWLIAALLALTVGFLWMQPGQETIPLTDPIYRSQESSTLSSLIPEDQPLSRQDPRLRWTASEEGARYHLLVSNAAFEVLYEVRDLTLPEALIPQSALSGLEPGDEIYWRVEAERLNGEAYSSPTFVTALE